MRNKRAHFVIWVITFLASCAFIYYGSQKVTKGLNLFGQEGVKAIEGKVYSVTGSKQEEGYDMSGAASITTVQFTCLIKEGEHKGEIVDATQIIEPAYQGYLKPVEAGDTILLYLFDQAGESSWNFTNYVRSNTILFLFIIFAVLVLLIGRLKGVNTIVSLTMTCLAVFLIFIPSVLNGYNVYLSSFIVCTFTIISTLLFVNGICIKSIVTMIGCIAGLVIASGLTFVMSKLLHLTGMVDEESYYLTMIQGTHPIDVKSIIFGCIVIGALGAIMDISMDISSSLYEIKKHRKDITFSEMLKSGMEIGRDVIGTMSNTLVLAYIGSSLSSILLLLTYSSSLFEVLNREMVIVDLLQAVIGSMAILLTIPFTAIVGAWLFTKGHDGEHDYNDNNKEFDVFWN